MSPGASAEAVIHQSLKLRGATRPGIAVTTLGCVMLGRSVHLSVLQLLNLEGGGHGLSLSQEMRFKRMNTYQMLRIVPGGRVGTE